MSTTDNDQQCVGGEEMISNTKECISREQNDVKNITEGINRVAVRDDMSTCANCGKEGDSLKTCTACFMVKYCNRDCQIAHRKQHKKECKKRAAELYDEKLFKEVEPEECPICMLPLPIDSNQSAFESCCGKRICNGCIYAMDMSEGKDLCAFCRTPPPSSDEEYLKRLNKLMNNGNGGGACFLLAGHYANGRKGLPRDIQKAVEFNLKAGELGCAEGYFNLGLAYRDGRGVELDEKKANHYYELAAMNGDIYARNNLGCIEGHAGNEHRAMKHFMLAARAGMKDSLEMVKIGFRNGKVTKDEYANTIRAYHKSIDGMKSESRDKMVEIFNNAGM